MARRILTAVAVLALVALLFGGAYWHWRDRILEQQRLDNKTQARVLLEEGRPQEALKLLGISREQLISLENAESDVVALAIWAYTRLNDAPALVTLYNHLPRAFDHAEESALLLSTGLIGQRRTDEYRILRERWDPRLKREAAWFVLDVDALLMDARRDDALALLNSRKFEGAEDTGRMIRLAMLAARDDLEKAWNILSEAQQKDPFNTEITSYRAQILEAINKPLLARVEYMKAVQKSPESPYLLHQLADFYRRQGQYPLALETWEKGMDLPESGLLWVKAWFWDKIMVPSYIEWDKHTRPNDDFEPLIAYLQGLPEGTFWSESEFAQVPNASKHLITLQETLWLRVLDCLQRGDETRALALLEHNPFNGQSYSHDLELALRRLLQYRTQKAIANERPTPPISNEQANSRHQFFRLLDELAANQQPGVPSQHLPENARALLQSELAIPAALLASGWLESAVLFSLPNKLPSYAPEWLPFAYTQALRYVKGPLEAITYALNQRPTDPLKLLTGEIMISMGSKKAGVDHLRSLVQKDSEFGQRAAWLTALVQLDDQEFDAARKTVEQNPKLADHIIGKETLAKIAYHEGNIADADRRFSRIEKESPEARFYLARRAYEEKEYGRALALTEHLLEEFPDNQQLREDQETLRGLVAEAEQQENDHDAH